MSKIFQHQLWHLLAAIVLLVALRALFENDPRMPDGELWGAGTRSWFWLAVWVPVAHQAYVWLVWRLELHRRTFTSRYGLDKAFRVYAVGFTVLFVGRLISIIFLAVSNRGSLEVDPRLTLLAAAVITPPVVWLFYSVKKYFGFIRAYGIDHFDPGYDKPFVRGGIFRYTNNGMYVFGLMTLYLPGLLTRSSAALLVALFNHVYVWVHYYCTERPDMKVIYGKTP